MAKLLVFGPPNAGSSVLTSTIYPNADGCAVSINWSGDHNPSAGGWETSSGSASAGYNFTNFDAVINNQLSYGAAGVAVILGPISFGGSNTATPNYVFTSGYAAANGYTQLYTAAGNDYTGSGAIAPGSSAQGVDNTAFPAAWMPAFKNAWIAAVQAALAHMKAASYASKILYVRVGGGAGGEWFPFATSAGTAGLLTIPGGPTSIATLETTWISGYMTAMESAIVAGNYGFPMIQATDGGFANEQVPYSWPDAEAAIAVSNGFGVGCEGLKGADITNFATFGTASGGANYSGYPSMDHAYTFNIGASILQFQTSAASDPTGVSAPGSLVLLLPYAVARLANATKYGSIEIYYQDWQVAYDPTNANNAVYGVAYQDVIQAARTITPGTITVTVTLQDLSGTALPDAWVRFRLRNFAGTVPRVAASAIIVETQIDAYPNGSGVVSQTLWPNGGITPANTFWTVEYHRKNRITSSANYVLNSSVDLSVAAQR